MFCREVLVQKTPRLQDSLGQGKCPGSKQFSRWFAIKLSEFARQGGCDATSSRGDPAGHANEQLAWLRSRCSPPTGYPGGNPLTSLRHVSLGSTADPSRALAQAARRDARPKRLQGGRHEPGRQAVPPDLAEQPSQGGALWLQGDGVDRRRDLRLNCRIEPAGILGQDLTCVAAVWRSRVGGGSPGPADRCVACSIRGGQPRP